MCLEGPCAFFGFLAMKSCCGEFFPAISARHEHESCTLGTQWSWPTSKCRGGGPGQNLDVFSLSLLHFAFGWIRRATANLWGSWWVFSQTELCTYRACASLGITMYLVSQPFLIQETMVPGNSLVSHMLLCIAACHKHCSSLITKSQGQASGLRPGEF